MALLAAAPFCFEVHTINLNEPSLIGQQDLALGNVECYYQLARKRYLDLPRFCRLASRLVKDRWKALGVFAGETFVGESLRKNTANGQIEPFAIIPETLVKSE